MTEQVNDRRARYIVTAPSGQTVFDIDFPLEDVDYIRVYKDGVLVSSDDYTVDLDLLKVTLLTTAAQNAVVVLEGLRVIERPTDYPLRGGLRTRLLNSDMDGFVQSLQEVRRDVDRTLILNPSDPSTVSNILPVATANRLLAFNADADGIIAGPLTTDVDIITANVDAIDAVSAGITSVVIVAADLDGDDNIGTVAENITDVVTVGGISAAVTTVAANDANITIVADDLDGSNTVGDVAGGMANVNAVGADLLGDDDIGTCADNMSDINDVADQINGAGFPVTSVNGETGVITLTQDHIGDGSTNKAYTATEKTKLSNIAAGAEVNQNAFTTFSVSGQSNVVADNKTDTVTFAAGTGMTITTTAGSDTITFTASGVAGVSSINGENGAVTFTTDDIYDGTTYVRFSATNRDKLASIAEQAEVNQNAFSTFAVSGQSNVVADSKTDTVTFVAGTGMTITTDAGSDTITFDASGSGEANQNAFSTISVSGQDSVVADSATDTVAFVAGDGITITTTAATDFVSFYADVVSVNGNTGAVVLDPDDLDDTSTTHKFVAAADITKLDYISVTQAVDLDDIETRVNALDAAVVLKGTWDASGGSFPGSGSAQAGDSYIVSVGGTVDSVEFAVNDRIVSITDNAATDTYDSNWHKLDYTDAVLSVNGKTGTVVLDPDDLDDTSTTNKFVAAADITKLDYISVTQAVDLDDIEASVDYLNAAVSTPTYDLGEDEDTFFVDGAHTFTDTAASTKNYVFDTSTPTGYVASFLLILTNGGSQTINWPESLVGTMPALTVSGEDHILFYTIDGGTSWYFSARLDVTA